MTRNYIFKLYGDDNNEAITEKYAHLYTFENRAKAYASLGVLLSKDKDVESDSPIGHVWLGKIIDWNEAAQAWVGKVNANKTLCSLLNLEGQNLDPEIVYMRTIALMVESTWTEPLFSYIRSYAQWLHGQVQLHYLDEVGDYGRWFASVPTREMCQKFWTGQESKGHRGIRQAVKNFLPPSHNPCYLVATAVAA